VILLLDNRDSFVHNVGHLLEGLGGEVRIVRSDALTVEEALALAPTHLVVSPGPCTPREAGISVPLIRALGGRIPVLGICLGHQALAAAYGAQIRPSPEPTHGRATPIRHLGLGVLRGVSNPFQAGRYHSLTVDSTTLPPSLEAHGWSAGGEIMALRRRGTEEWGVQFHPESILTPEGERVMSNFLAMGEVPA